MSSLKTLLHRWLVTDRLIGRRVLASLAWIVHKRGNCNPGWYGVDPAHAVTGSWRGLRNPKLRGLAVALSARLDLYCDEVFVNEVWRPISGPHGNNLQPLRAPTDPELCLGDEYLRARQPAAPASDAPPSFSIVTPYYRHFAYFNECARSVAKAMRGLGSLQAEWVVVNDDPNMPSDRLRSALPASISDRTRIITNSSNLGNTATLNAGIEASRFGWILFLDCDDILYGLALSVLARYITAFPRCRYFSSSMVDIDSEGRFLRYRMRDTGPTQMFTEGMTAGHLKAIRRDAFDDLGLLDQRFDGCQDYEFAMRIAMVEPICFVPEFLYGYRSHANTQTLGGLERQLSRAREIRKLYLTKLLGLIPAGSGAMPSPPGAGGTTGGYVDS
jgi:GT2 family glycosyltransferase